MSTTSLPNPTLVHVLHSLQQFIEEKQCMHTSMQHHIFLQACIHMYLYMYACMILHKTRTQLHGHVYAVDCDALQCAR